LNDYSSHPYTRLTPDVILDAVDTAGYLTSGSLLALNSYENRVYQVELTSGEFLVAKFYRPGRWERDVILEEHEFAHQLAQQDIPLIAPLRDAEGNTLFSHAGFDYALFPRRGGRAPELDDPEHLRWLGRLIGRIHVVGASQSFRHRPELNTQRLGHDSLQFLLQQNVIPAELRHNFQLAAQTLLQQVDAAFEAVGPYPRLRLHGDCHPGNILWTDSGPHFVDLDDCQQGPAIQDLWMLLSGEADEMAHQFNLILQGYESFRLFDPIELVLLEPLRALRLLNYSAWLARRRDDPAFVHAFPWFGHARYWEDQLMVLREQCERMQLPTLKL